MVLLGEDDKQREEMREKGERRMYKCVPEANLVRCRFTCHFTLTCRIFNIELRRLKRRYICTFCLCSFCSSFSFLSIFFTAIESLLLYSLCLSRPLPSFLSHLSPSLPVLTHLKVFRPLSAKPHDIWAGTANHTSIPSEVFSTAVHVY